MSDVQLTRAAECDIEVMEGDKLDSTNAQITIKDADGVNINMSSYTDVEFNIYRDETFKSLIYTFKNTSGGDGTMTLGDGYFILEADPFPLSEGEYRYGLRELDSPITLAVGKFIVSRRY